MITKTYKPVYTRDSHGEIVEAKTSHYYIRVESPSELLLATESMLDCSYKESRDTTQPTFSGTKTWEEAVELLRYGYPDGVKTMKELIKKHKVSFEDYFPKQNFAQEVKFSADGEVFSPERFYSGDPEHMRKFKHTRSDKLGFGGKCQKLIYTGTKSCYVAKEVFFHEGIIIAKLIEDLELSGFTTEIIVRFPITGRGGLDFVADIVAKNFSEGLDLDKLCFLMAHASSLRRFCFALVDNSDLQTVRNVGSHYGHPCEYSLDLIHENGDENLIKLANINGNYSFEQILAKTLEVIKQKFTSVKAKEDVI